MTNIKWLLTTALSIIVIALGAVCRYKTCGVFATGGELMIALALPIIVGVHERRKRWNSR